MNQDPNDLTPPKLRLVRTDEHGFHVEDILPSQFSVDGIPMAPAVDFEEVFGLGNHAVDAAYHAKRKAQPIARGALDYFPDALLAVAELSRIANEQHNPGEPMHWAKHKSTDHADCLVRHLIERGQTDPTTGMSHTVAVAWRALALLQTEIEAAREKRR